jgi:hypothetical protein
LQKGIQHSRRISALKRPDSNDLFEAFREALRQPSAAVAMLDLNGKSWNVFARKKESGFAFSLEGGDAKFPLSDHSALSETADIRLAWFEKVAASANLPASDSEKWRLRLSQAALEDEEFDELMEDINLTPIRWLGQVREKIARQEVNLADLAPNDRRYFERLIGKLGEKGDAESYIEEGAKPLTAQLLDMHMPYGFLLALILGSAGSISAVVDPSRLTHEELSKAFEWLAAKGDLISQISAIEIGLAFLDRCPQLEPFIETLILLIIEDDPSKDGSRFSQLSGLIV